MKATWSHEFAANYLRLSQRSGLKVLCCFPECGEGGHTSQKECRRRAQCTVTGLVPQEKTRDVLAWAQLVECASGDQTRRGSTIELSEARAKERSQDAAWLPCLVRWDKQAGHTLHITVNEEQRPWHYGWVSTKHTCDAQHMLKVRVFFDVGDAEIVFAGFVTSPQFRVHAKRRKRGAAVVGDQGEQQVPPASKKARKDAEGPASPSAVDVESAVKGMPELVPRMPNRSGSGLMRFVGDLATRAAATFGLASLDMGGPARRSSDELRRNRTLDRLSAIVFESGASGALPAGCSGLDDGFEAEAATATLRGVLLEHWHVPLAVVDSTMERLDQLADYAGKLPRDNDSFERLVRRYSTPDGLLALREQIRCETEDVHFRWTPEHSSETFLAENPAANRENSIYAAARQNIRNLIAYSLESCGLSVDEFDMPMEVAVQHGLAGPDPWYPPPLRIAVFMHLQLHGRMRGFDPAHYSCGQARFPSQAAQERYARDMILVLRGVFRQMMCHRMRHDQLKQEVNGLCEPPVPLQYDINGRWLQADASQIQESAQMQQVAKIFSTMIGTTFGTFFARVFTQAFASMNIRISATSVTLKLAAVMFEQVVLHARFEGPALETTLPFPAPMSIGPEVRQCQITAWLSQDDAHLPTVNVCIGCAALATGVTEALSGRLLRAALPNRPGPPEHIKFLDWVQKRNEDVERHPPVMRYRLELRVLTPSTISLRLAVWAFACESQAPALADVQAMSSLHSNPAAWLAGVLDLGTYVRSLVSAEDADLLVELL